jgi:hypothetical protein
LASNSTCNPQGLHGSRRFLLAGLVLVALGAGLIAALGCGGGSNSKAESVIGKLLEVGQNPGTDTQVLVDKLPPDLPDGLPSYPGSSLLGSTITTSGGTKSLGVLSESGDPVDKVYTFYEQELDKDPWTVEISSFPSQAAGVQFTSASDPNLVGAVVIQASGDSSDSLIYLSVQNTSEAASPTPFKVEPSKPLPRDWPSQVPLYPNASITGTAWGRSVGASEWQISFIAQTTATDIIDFYRTQLTNGGFVVTDEAPQNGVSMLSFKNVQTTETWNGGVSAQTSTGDPSYAQGTVQISISSNATPQPSGTPTP